MKEKVTVSLFRHDSHQATYENCTDVEVLCEGAVIRFVTEKGIRMLSSLQFVTKYDPEVSK